MLAQRNPFCQMQIAPILLAANKRLFDGSLLSGFFTEAPRELDFGVQRYLYSSNNQLARLASGIINIKKVKLDKV